MEDAIRLLTALAALIAAGFNMRCLLCYRALPNTRKYVKALAVVALVVMAGFQVADVLGWVSPGEGYLPGALLTASMTAFAMSDYALFRNWPWNGKGPDGH